MAAKLERYDSDRSWKWVSTPTESTNASARDGTTVDKVDVLIRLALATDWSFSARALKDEVVTLEADGIDPPPAQALRAKQPRTNGVKFEDREPQPRHNVVLGTPLAKLCDDREM